MRVGRTVAAATVLAACIASAPGAFAVAVGEQAPACTAADAGSAPPFDPARFRGRVVYVDFWASWCAPCAEAFPFLDALQRESGAAGLQVLGIGLDERPEAARRFLERHPVGFAITADASGRCPRLFGVEAMPSSYLVDRRGRVRHVHRGFRAGDVPELRRRVRQLLDEDSPDGR